MLFLLAASEGALARDEIIDLLWGTGFDPERAKRAFSVSISRLRQALPEGVLVKEGGAFRLITGGSVFSDYRAFMEAVTLHLPKAERISNEEPLPSAVLNALLEAVRLWRGRFLEGFVPPAGAAEFESWMLQKEGELQEHHLALLRRLAWHFWAERDLGSAIQFARRALTISPADEDLLLMVLRALHWQGKLGVAREFLAEMQARHEELFGEGYSESTLQASRPYLNPVASPSLSHAASTPNVPFVGYEEELSAIKRRLLEGGAVLLTGQSGQGKSRLLQELGAQFSRNWRVISVSCHQGENYLPFAPLLEALPKFVKDEEWQKVPQEWWPHLLLLFPEIELMLPPVVLPKPSAILQAQFMEALRQLLLVMAEENPILLTVDDLQWADLATVETLIYWHSRPPFKKTQFGSLGAIVMAARQTSLETSPTVKPLLPLLSSGAIPTFVLSGLSTRNVRVLAEHVAGRRFSEEEVAALWRLSMAGTPLYLLEILRFQLKTDNINKPVHEWVLPDTLTALLETRLRGLSENAVEVLQFVAVQGTEIPYHVLRLAVRQDEESLSEALDELLKAKWLEYQANDGQVLYSFSHNRMRDVIAARISPGRRQLINARLAQAWEEALGDAARRKAAVIAYHYQQAAEPKAAFYWWIEAARHALSIGVAEQAHQAFRNAEKLVLGENSPFSDRQIWSLYADWQVLAADTLAVDVLKHIAEQLKTLARLHGSLLLEGAALNAEAVLASLSDNVQEEERLSRKAVRILQAEPGAEIAFVEACATLGGALSIQTKVRESLNCLRRGLDALKGHEEDEDAARAFGSLHYQLAVTSALALNPQKSLEHANASLDAYRRSHRVFGVAQALAARTLALLRLRRYAEALQDCKDAVEQVLLLKKVRLWGFLNAYCAMIHMSTGELKQLRETVLKVQGEIAKGQPIPRGALYLIEGALGDAFLHLDDWHKAVEHYERAIQFGGDLLAPGDLLPRLALAHAFLGEVEKAEEEIGRAAMIYRRELGEPRGFIQIDEAIVHYVKGERERVISELEPILQDSELLETAARSLGYLVLAHIQAELGHRHAAVRFAKKSLELAEQSEFYWMAMRALAELAALGALTPAQAKQLKSLYGKLLPLVEDEFWGESVRRFLETYPLSPLSES